MDFVRSYFFTNANLTSCPIFFILSSLLGGFAVALLLLCCCTHPKVMTKWKKWATGQSCIHKEVSNFLQNPHFSWFFHHLQTEQSQNSSQKSRWLLLIRNYFFIVDHADNEWEVTRAIWNILFGAERCPW